MTFTLLSQPVKIFVGSSATKLDLRQESSLRIEILKQAIEIWIHQSDEGEHIIFWSQRYITYMNIYIYTVYKHYTHIADTKNIIYIYKSLERQQNIQTNRKTHWLNWGWTLQVGSADLVMKPGVPWRKNVDFSTSESTAQKWRSWIHPKNWKNWSTLLVWKVKGCWIGNSGIRLLSEEIFPSLESWGMLDWSPNFGNLRKTVTTSASAGKAQHYPVKAQPGFRFVQWGEDGKMHLELELKKVRWKIPTSQSFLKTAYQTIMTKKDGRTHRLQITQECWRYHWN